MAVMRVHKNANYTVMSNYHFKEKAMSLKAKGLLSLMLSLPDDWDYSIAGLATLSKDGKDSVMSALKELETFGYLIRTRLTDEKGRFAGYDYDIYEEPQASSPYSEKPKTGKSEAENPQQLNTKSNNSVGIKSLKNKDKKDKEDKRENPFYVKPNSFTKELIKAEYIEDDDLFLTVYNQYFFDLMTQYDFEQIRACLWYFVKRLRNGKAYDGNGVEIENKFAYLKASIQNGLDKITNEDDPFSDEAIKKTLALLAK